MSILARLDVSYGSALLAVPLRRLTSKAGSAINISPLLRGDVYLWAAYTDGTGDDAVLEVCILRGDEEPRPAPSGRWAKVRRDLSAGKALIPSFLAYRVGVASAAEPPIVAVAVLRAGEEPGAFKIWGEYLPCSRGCTRAV